jgi:diacylglycerol kinase family enzyme
MSAVPYDPPAADAPAPELVLVMNQGSGKQEKSSVRQALEQEFAAAGRRHRFVPVNPGEIVQACQQAAREAREQGGVLVAVGGDGTINCAAQAAVLHDCPLGIIAQGTFNLFARQHGLPLEAAEAARALLRAQPEPVQVGWLNQRVFLVNASVGLYPKLLADRETAKQKLGRRRWIAMLAALKTLFEWRQQLVLDVDLDGELSRLRTASLFVGNNALQLERVGIAPDVVAQVGKGRLAGILARRTGLGAKLRLLARALLGTLSEEPNLDSFTLRTLTVTTRHARKLRIATDGEVQWMELPLRFSVAPRPLFVMLPPPAERLPVQ